MACCARLQDMRAAAMADGELTFDDVVEALKTLLEEGIRWAVKTTAKPGGFFNNKAIKIPFPSELRSARKKLEKVGFRDRIKAFVERLNHAAEKAAPKALDVFVNAVQGLSLDRVNDILHGAADAATEYLRECCFEPLAEIFEEIIERVLERSKATSMFDDLLDAYNAIPFVSDIDFSLPLYTTHRALDGLFHEIAKREAKMRESPELASSAKLVAMLDNIDDLFFGSSSDSYSDSDASRSTSASASDDRSDSGDDSDSDSS